MNIGGKGIIRQDSKKYIDIMLFRPRKEHQQAEPCLMPVFKYGYGSLLTWHKPKDARSRAGLGMFRVAKYQSVSPQVRNVYVLGGPPTSWVRLEWKSQRLIGEHCVGLL